MKIFTLVVRCTCEKTENRKMIDVLPEVLQYAKQVNNRYLNECDVNCEPFEPELYRIVCALRFELANMKHLIGEVRRKVSQVHSVNPVLCRESNDPQQQIERAMNDVNQLARKLRAHLDALGEGVPRLQEAVADEGLDTVVRIRINFHAALSSAFMQVMHAGAPGATGRLPGPGQAVRRHTIEDKESERN
jgi:hypothetical protein